MGIVVAVPEPQMGRVIAAICAREGVMVPGNPVAGAEIVAAVCLRWLTDATVEYEGAQARAAIIGRSDDALRQAERTAADALVKARQRDDAAPELPVDPVVKGRL